ncbi:hypothetical protein C2E23DRAFT_411841 [Lenzites betulinus]|nr:hypothetical protein C2E23DRAFT_411841 [Lenzites betulinus]
MDDRGGETGRCEAIHRPDAYGAASVPWRNLAPCQGAKGCLCFVRVALGCEGLRCGAATVVLHPNLGHSKASQGKRMARPAQIQILHRVVCRVDLLHAGTSNVIEVFSNNHPDAYGGTAAARAHCSCVLHVRTARERRTPPAIISSTFSPLPIIRSRTSKLQRSISRSNIMSRTFNRAIHRNISGKYCMRPCGGAACRVSNVPEQVGWPARSNTAMAHVDL